MIAVKFNGGVAIAADNLGTLESSIHKYWAFLMIGSLAQHLTGLSLGSPMLNDFEPLEIPLWSDLVVTCLICNISTVS